MDTDPEKRLGSSRDGEEVMRHEWFEGVNWEKIAKVRLLLRRGSPSGTKKNRSIFYAHTAPGGAPSRETKQPPAMYEHDIQCWGRRAERHVQEDLILTRIVGVSQMLLHKDLR